MNGQVLLADISFPRWSHDHLVALIPQDASIYPFLQANECWSFQVISQKEIDMAIEDHENQQPQEIPRGQKFFDNLFWLFLLSLLISLLLFNVWGVIEVLSVPAG